MAAVVTALRERATAQRRQTVLYDLARPFATICDRNLLRYQTSAPAGA